MAQEKEWALAHTECSQARSALCECMHLQNRCAFYLIELSHVTLSFLVMLFHVTLSCHVILLSFKVMLSCQATLSRHTTLLFLVQGFSTSETWYAYLDYGTNYCNLRNLADGAGLTVSQYGFKEETSDSVCTQYSSHNCAKYWDQLCNNGVWLCNAKES